MNRSPHKVLCRSAGAVVLAVLLLASCTPSGSGRKAGPTASATVSASARALGRGSASTATPPVVPPAPKARGCYRMTLTELARPTSDLPPVDCGARHVTQTIFVGRLDTVVDGHSLAVDSDVARRQLMRTCPDKLAGYVGGTVSQRRLSRFQVVWFSPTLAQSDRGADWFRCDLIAFATEDTLFPLPPPRRLRGVLGRDGALASYGLCGTAAPGTTNFHRVICAREHSWKAITTIDLGGGATYPGERQVSRAGDNTCKDRVRAYLGLSLKFRYGWEWPTRQQWKRGQHYGFCWAPD
jgi:hypothetical protein